MHYQWIDKSHPQRGQVEHFICERYWLSFKACLQNLPPRLLAVFHGDKLIAACGVQFAEQQELFSEQYLPQPLQQYQIHQKRIDDRRQLAEIGSMAALDASHLPVLFGVIVKALLGEQKEALVFTATRALQRYFARQGISLTQLAIAEKAALPESAQDIWGNYYNHSPMLLAGWLEQGADLQDVLAKEQM